ncbi:MAG TPA: hypothetical protein DCX21_00890 [Eubacterium sp.]|nr:hypothetical protein [Eubacterium sp.]HBZ52584.1 hypothetical protein [Eubacterium sp.]
MNIIAAYKSTNSIWQLLTLVLIFAFILAATYFATRFLGGFQYSAMMRSNIKILDTLRATGNMFYQIVKAGDKCYLVAVSKDNIVCLGEVDEETLELHTVENKSFADILGKFKKKDKDDKDENI